MNNLFAELVPSNGWGYNDNSVPLLAPPVVLRHEVGG